MPFVALIGANHAHQYPRNRNGSSARFEAYLKSRAEHYQVDLLGEEMNREALDKARVLRSSVHEVAIRLQLTHIMCDPDSEERRLLGIPTYEELKQRRGFTHVFEEQERILNADERSYWPIREREWLRRLTTVAHNRVLFVLGPNHVKTFEQLLISNCYEVEVVSTRWEA